MAEFYSENKIINGKKYTAQFSGMRTAYRYEDENYIDGTMVTSLEKSINFLFDYVIVDPKGLTPDDFGREKIGETKTRVINDKEYTAEFKGLSTALRAVDDCRTETGGISKLKDAEYILKNIIVSPDNLTVDDFDSKKELDAVVEFGREVMQNRESLDELNEVVDFARRVLQGEFRTTDNKRTAKKKG